MREKTMDMTEMQGSRGGGGGGTLGRTISVFASERRRGGEGEGGGVQLVGYVPM